MLLPCHLKKTWKFLETWIYLKTETVQKFTVREYSGLLVWSWQVFAVSIQ